MVIVGALPFIASEKLVLIDNAEFLNLNSSNALLKAIEKPSNDTHFFING